VIRVDRAPRCGSWHGVGSVRRRARDGSSAGGGGRGAGGISVDGWSATPRIESVDAFRAYRDQAYPQRHFPSGTRLCAEGFRDGQSVGLPCGTVTGRGWHADRYGTYGVSVALHEIERANQFVGAYPHQQAL
jgi:hypothetical protein